MKKYKLDQLLHSIYQYSCLVDFLPNLIPKLYILKQQKKRHPTGCPFYHACELPLKFKHIKKAR